jgi:hypothetical protein
MAARFFFISHSKYGFRVTRFLKKSPIFRSNLVISGYEFEILWGTYMVNCHCEEGASPTKQSLFVWRPLFNGTWSLPCSYGAYKVRNEKLCVVCHFLCRKTFFQRPGRINKSPQEQKYFSHPLPEAEQYFLGFFCHRQTEHKYCHFLFAARQYENIHPGTPVPQKNLPNAVG